MGVGIAAGWMLGEPHRPAAGVGAAGSSMSMRWMRNLLEPAHRVQGLGCASFRWQRFGTQRLSDQRTVSLLERLSATVQVAENMRLRTGVVLVARHGQLQARQGGGEEGGAVVAQRPLHRVHVHGHLFVRSTAVMTCLASRETRGTSLPFLAVLAAGRHGAETCTEAGMLRVMCRNPRSNHQESPERLPRVQG